MHPLFYGKVFRLPHLYANRSSIDLAEGRAVPPGQYRDPHSSSDAARPTHEDIEGTIRGKRPKRLRGRTTRRLARIASREARATQKEALAAVATYNVYTLAVKGKNGYGRAECVLAKARQLGCHFIGLHETRRTGK